MNTLLARMQFKLAEREKNGNLRTLHSQKLPYDFSSNDYLGLSKSKPLQAYVESKLATLNHYELGATGSRLISGTNVYTLETEDFLAQLFKKEAALVFNSGYQANTALLSTIPQKGDTIICDELIHASLREGARLSFADNYYFKHNDTEDLGKKLERAKGEKFVVIESVYSMDGDLGAIKEILEVCKLYQAHLIVDEAHSTGLFGDRGSGLVCELGLEQEVWAIIYTFGKAMGCHGACIVGSNLLKSYLVNFARAFIYTTALPPHSLVSIKSAFEWVAQNPHLWQDLKGKLKRFKDIVNQLHHPFIALKESNTPIQILKVGGNIATKQLAQKLQNEGFDVRPILAPTVKEGEEIIRICLHSFNTNEQIDTLANCICDLAKEISK